MFKDTIYKFPFIKNNICPVCGKKISEYKTFQTVGNSKEISGYRILFCSECKIPYMTKKTKDLIAKENNYTIPVFSINNEQTKESVRDQCTRNFPRQEKSIRKFLYMIYCEIPPEG